MDNLFFPFDLSDFPTVDKEKRRDEIIEATKALNKMIGVREEWSQAKKDVNDLDLNEFKEAYARAKKRSLKPFSGDYYIGYYAKLPYVVPVAFQGTIALIFDLEGNVINNVYNQDPKYKIMNMSLCIFPLKTTSIIMMFVSKDNNRYGRFFKQLKKLGSLNEQLSVINYILFSYSEDYFLSSNIPQNILKELVALSGKTPELLTLTPPSPERILEAAKEIFDFRDRQNIPNLLSSQFALNNE